MSFTTSQYEHLSALLNHYRSSHSLDRAAKSAVSLLCSDIEEAAHKHKKQSKLPSAEDVEYTSTQDIPIKDLERVALSFKIKPGWNSSDIIHMLSERGYIDASDANHYYRALVAAQSAIDKVNSK